MIFQGLLMFVVLFFTLYSQVHTGFLLALCLLLCGLTAPAHRGHCHQPGAYLSIDYRAHQSRLSHWNTGLKTGLAIFCLFFCISVSSISVPVYLLLGMSLLTVAGGRTPLAYYFSLLTVPVMFILLSCLAILVEFSPEPLGVLSFPMGRWYLSILPENQEMALRTMLRSIGAVSCLYMLSLSTPLYRVIALLRSAKVPAIVIDLMYLIYRYLFILLEVHQNMVHAAASRLGYRSCRISIKTMLNNAFNLLFISFRQTSNRLAAMEARCYNGEVRFLHKTFALGSGQVLWSAALGGGAVLLWFLTKGGVG